MPSGAPDDVSSEGFTSLCRLPELAAAAQPLPPGTNRQMIRPQFMANLSRKLRHRRMRRRDSPRRGWSDRVSLFTYNLTRPLRHRRMKRLTSPRQSWFERLELLTHNLTRPLRRRRQKRLNSPGSGWAARLELLTHNLTRPLRRRRQKRLDSPGSRWTVKLSQLLRHLTQPVRRVLRVWLRPVRKKWNNRSLSQRTSFGLLALGVVIVVVGVAVILPNVERPAVNPPSAINGEIGNDENTQPVASLDQNPRLDQRPSLLGQCDHPSIRAAIDGAVPGAISGGTLCSLEWMAVDLAVSSSGPTSLLVAYLKANEDGSWELVAISNEEGESIVGDRTSVSPAFLRLSLEA